MNYLTLKNLLETITKTYKCPWCQSGIDESNIDIMWTAWNTINIDLECKKCWKHSIMRADINYVEEKKLNKDFLDKIKQSLNEIKNKKNPKNKLKDNDISELNKKIRTKNIDIKKLFEE